MLFSFLLAKLPNQILRTENFSTFLQTVKSKKSNKIEQILQAEKRVPKIHESCLEKSVKFLEKIMNRRDCFIKQQAHEFIEYCDK